MNLDTTERTLEREFGKFGKLQKVKVVRNIGTGTSRGFAFVYFEDSDDAKMARDEMNGKKEIDGHAIRIDYSVGRRERSTGNRGYYGSSFYPSFYDRHEGHHENKYYGYYGHGRNRRSPSPHQRRRSSRHRSRTRSVSPRH
jgi:transformer-2 protein